jgi:hypothetical protein
VVLVATGVVGIERVFVVTEGGAVEGERDLEVRRQAAGEES